MNGEKNLEEGICSFPNCIFPSFLCTDLIRVSIMTVFVHGVNHGIFSINHGIFSILVLILLCMPTMVVQSIYSVEQLAQDGGRTRPECMMGGIYNSQGNASIHGKGGETQHLP